MFYRQFWSDRSGVAPIVNALFGLAGFVGLLAGGGMLMFTYTDADMPRFLSDLLGL